MIPQGEAGLPFLPLPPVTSYTGHRPTRGHQVLMADFSLINPIRTDPYPGVDMEIQLLQDQCLTWGSRYHCHHGHHRHHPPRDTAATRAISRVPQCWPFLLVSGQFVAAFNAHYPSHLGGTCKQDSGSSSPLAATRGQAQARHVARQAISNHPRAVYDSKQDRETVSAAFKFDVRALLCQQIPAVALLEYKADQSREAGGYGAGSRESKGARSI